MENHRQTALFVVPNLDSGGAERTILNIVNRLDRSVFKPVLVLYQKRGALLKRLGEDVEIVDLQASRARFAVLSLARVIRKIKPAVILSTIRYANAATVFAALLARSRATVVVRETNNFTAAGVSVKGRKERVVGWCYRHADLVVALSEGVRRDVMARYAVPQERVRTIYNPVNIEEVQKMAELPLPPHPDLRIPEPGVFNIIAVGHLKRQKGFDLLIRAIAELQDVPLRLLIVGDGPEEADLRQLIRDLNLSDKVRLLGYQENPYALMAKSDLFVLSSRWEGFGHVIVEAMACGVPVLATRCPSGPDEIINHDIDGMLCEPDSVDALVAGIQRLWRDQAARKAYAEKAKKTAARFDVRAITREYETIFRNSNDYEEKNYA